MLKSFPTNYGAVNFRSRLEARWAAFFDLAGWDWEYEPPVEHGFWIPDFALRGRGGTTLVEVKPIDWGESLDESTKALDEPELNKVLDSGVDEVLVLGLRPIEASLGDDIHDHSGCRVPVLGLLAYCDRNMLNELGESTT